MAIIQGKLSSHKLPRAARLPWLSLYTTRQHTEREVKLLTRVGYQEPRIARVILLVWPAY